MDISNSEYKVSYENSDYVVYVDDIVLKTPNGKDVAHKNIRLINHIISDLECRELIDPSQLSYYSLYSTFYDFFLDLTIEIPKEQLRFYILSDLTLKACAGPERIYQFDKWGALFQLLEERNLKYPDFPQFFDMSDIENWLMESSEETQTYVNDFVDYIHREFTLLSNEQKSVVINCCTVHNSIVYGILLSTKKCTETEYATAILAGLCEIPMVFSDVDRNEYQQAFNSLILDANIISNFIHFTLTPNINTVDLIKQQIPNYAFIPDGSRVALTEALNKISEGNSEDYSSYIVLLGKAVEIALKQNIFDPFQQKFSKIFTEETNVKIFIKNNEDIEKLASYLVKKPHFIELGSMLVILEKYGGKTASKNETLQQFFEFINKELYAGKILNKSVIEKAKELARYRNKAAHEERFSLLDAKNISAICFEVISMI